ncbi:NAD(P)H-binding protein [Undibacterium terreum]|uniref:NAD(P)-binding domain-containing protein n=1 Tax=Undibacterium terreum TaxID=1224302 RepID=A0A916XDX4_9BURK|nr:NAD(P)H-binding protein [Undibacterium terreum]GGC66401.1 hypothetical protein GCM10011396_11830 [Undibacterium terreum]
MSRYAVIGASSGTGLALVRHLESQQLAVRAISRHPPQKSEFIEPYAADITDAKAISAALDGQFDAVFFTVDIHGLFNSRESIRAVMYQGCVNAIQACESAATKFGSAPKFILLSVIGANQPSWVWHLLNAAKRGMQKNILDREQALQNSSLPYIICRAPKLSDTAASQTAIAATPPQHKLDMAMGIARIDLARTLLLAAGHAPGHSSWDVYADAAGPVPNWLRTA